MSLDDAKKEIKIINEYLKKFTWMDFTYGSINMGCIELIGSDDLTYEDNDFLKILFEEPLFISTLLNEWHKHDEKPFIEIASEEECINKFGHIYNKDCIIFKINVEDYNDAPVWVVSKKIKCIILKP